jgi:hypothetical protein
MHDDAVNVGNRASISARPPLAASLSSAEPSTLFSFFLKRGTSHEELVPSEAEVQITASTRQWKQDRNPRNLLKTHAGPKIYPSITRAVCAFHFPASGIGL